MVLEIKLLEVLAALVQRAQSHDLVVTGFDFALHLFELLLKLEVGLEQRLVFLADFVGALIRAAQLICPLLVLCTVSVPVRRRAAKAVLSCVVLGSDIPMPSLFLLECLRDLKCLLRASEHVVHLPSGSEPAKNLVLRWEIQLLHDLIELHPQLEVLPVKLLKREVLLADEEP